MPLQVMDINESPVFLLLDDNTTVKHKSLPVDLYESGTLVLLTVVFQVPVCKREHVSLLQAVLLCSQLLSCRAPYP